MTSKRGWLIAIVIAVMPAIVAVTIYFTIGRIETRYEMVGPPKPEAPPDLAKLRPAFSAGLQALQQKDGPAAVRHFSSFKCGQRDVVAVLNAARDIAVKNPRAPQAGDAISILRLLTSQKPTDPIKLTSPQRLERAVSLLRDGDPQNALAELNTFDTARAFAEFRLPIQLNKGLALNQLHRYEESNKMLEPLASGPYKIAIPAIYTASKNHRLLALAINPIVNKTIIVKQRVGTIRVPA